MGKNKSGSEKIVIIGGGFAGLALVNKLRRTGSEITLIDRNNYHKFQPLLYQAATSALTANDITFPFRKLFRRKKGVFFRMGEVTRIDPEGRKVHTSHAEFSYDKLIIASGSTTNFFGNVNVEKSTVPMKEVSEALEIRNNLLRNLELAMTESDPVEKQKLMSVVIVGGGASGIELAGAIGEMKKYILPKDYPDLDIGNFKIYLIEGADRLIPSMSEKTSARTLDYLTGIGIQVKLGTLVKDYINYDVMLGTGEKISTRNVIWTSGVKVTLPEGLESAVKSKAGRIKTDKYFRVVGYEDIYAVGDAAWVDDPAFPNGHPQLAREAIEQAHRLGSNFKRIKAGKEIKPYHRKEYPILAVVGRNHAFAEYKGVKLSGFIAWVFWAAVHIYSLLGTWNKMSVMFQWFWSYLTMDHPDRIILKADSKPGDDDINVKYRRQ